MKLKMNKAYDLNSISVLPPQSRRLRSMQAGQQASQLRPQPSQQSFSQGIPSQHGMFSQLSQSSLDDPLRFFSQERENSVKKASCLPPSAYSREESQMPMSRNSSNLVCKWNPASVPDHNRQINEELEHRIGMIETSLNKFGMKLDSMQSDIMQVNKGTKEASLETDRVWQKLTVIDNSLQLLNKGQADANESMKSLSEQMNKDMYQDKFQQIFLALSALAQQIEAYIQRLQNELPMTLTKEVQEALTKEVQQALTKEVQAMACSLKTTHQKSQSVPLLIPKVSSGGAASQRRPEPFSIPAMPSKACGKSTIVPKAELGNCVSPGVAQAKSNKRPLQKEQDRKRISFTLQEVLEKQHIVISDSDEELDKVFSCCLDKDTGIKNNLLDEETERILRKARRRQRRKCCNPRIIS